MSGFSREVQLATGLLLGGSGSGSGFGSLPLLQLHRELVQRCDLSEEEFCFMVQKCPRFLLVRDPAADGALRPEDCTVVAQTSLRLCSRYGRGQCPGGPGPGGPGPGGAGGPEGPGDCQQLHLCKYFIYGTCRFGKGRKPCKFSHDLRSDHNLRLLRDCTLHELNQDQLILLLLQNDPGLLPEVCQHYNRGGGGGSQGGCSFGATCSKVHLCQHFVQGSCAFGRHCHRLHAVDPPGRRALEDRGLSDDIISQLPSIYRNVQHLATAAAAATDKISDSSYNGVDQTDERQEICLHFTRNSCKFQDQCRRVHFHLPYKWEVFDGVGWTDLPHMEDLERDFCDPSKTQSGGDRPVDFLTMTQARRHVRRLSTASSVTKPPHYLLTTRWLWYYKGDRGNWVEYGQPDEKLRTTSVTSRTLEEAFLSHRDHQVPVVKGQRHYVLSFKGLTGGPSGLTRDPQV
ncbi:protein mono-ADP-ribosyltransferase PARP12b isoform X2 [Centropristis striata]|uniref:protein mono-ADP-ribosyltransferase PARP12b isoform X2 n=1 Tax=Centropristis striata TaxID=184440 RepID=UPI0027DFB558|nr:protein mono-ADP-ribosyltransferase PARP12b isoform X2 [Centropristis striata]